MKRKLTTLTVATVLALGALAVTAGPGATGTASRAAASAAAAASATTLPSTSITVNGSGGDRVYDGVGAILGGGGNARYLMDYPEPERTQILDYLFKPGYGASLQVLKLEIGGGANSSDGSEPSVEPAPGDINCDAGYEFAIAKQAVALDPNIKLYGLQWSAPGWVDTDASPRPGQPTVFTHPDVQYLLDWLGCAKKWGLTINYLGGWNERDLGSHRPWWAYLRSQLNNAGYKRLQLVAGDSKWVYSNPNDANIAILGAHDVCDYPTGKAGPATKCSGPALPAKGKPGHGKTAWVSELGGMDAGAQARCKEPCAPAMDLAMIHGYDQAKLTGFLEWPVLDAMPPGLPYENRGLITADQPWSGNYSVNAMTWAIAQFTQFVWPPRTSNPGGWKYLDSASGALQGSKDYADGSYVTLVRSGGTGWSTIIETTGVSREQKATFTITGGSKSLASDTVHEWASDFKPGNSGDNPSGWFDHKADIKPAGGKFTITIEPGWVYSLTTTTGQGKLTLASPIPPAANFALPYDQSDDLATPGQNAMSSDDEPQYLAAQQGSFELEPCLVADGSNTTCTEQTTMPTPVFWDQSAGQYYPYATIGNGSLQDYTVSVDALLTQAGTSAGVIGHFSHRAWDTGYFDGYILDVSTSGAWKLIKNNENGTPTTLTQGTVAALGTGGWNNLSMSFATSTSGTTTTVTITASIDHSKVGSATDTLPTASSPWAAGAAGIEAGAFTSTFPQAQYSDLSITS
jgi:O-glycosyl hydrolase